MRRFLAIALIGIGALLSACSGGNQALLASGGRDDFSQMQRIGEEYANEPDATVPVMVGDVRYDYRVWISNNRRRIMVQSASMAGLAAAGFVRGLTMGAVQGEIDYEPIEQAALGYLTTTRGPACRLMNSRKLTKVGWEWDFDCPARPGVRNAR